MTGVEDGVTYVNVFNEDDAITVADGKVQVIFDDSLEPKIYMASRVGQRGKWKPLTSLRVCASLVHVLQVLPLVVLSLFKPSKPQAHLPFLMANKR